MKLISNSTELEIFYAKRLNSDKYVKIISITPCWRHVNKDYSCYYNNVCSKCPGAVLLSDNPHKTCYGYGGNHYILLFYTKNFKLIDKKDIEVCL